MSWFFLYFVLFLSTIGLQANLKVLHLSFHYGTIREFEGVAKELGFDLTSLYIPKMAAFAFDPASINSNALYNIGHERAERIWNAHKDYFNSFDVVVTSDTGPLCRIFLQNDFKKRLVVWVCNRIDYFDAQSLDCQFPDPEYYQLLRRATKDKNVTFIGYTPFENYYAKARGVNIGERVIKPCSPLVEKLVTSAIPQSVDKKNTFLLPPRHNETLFMDLANHLKKLGIKNYCGNYNGPADIIDFKGIIHLPYAWSNLALFENLQLGMCYFVPSERFLLILAKSGNYWFQDREHITKVKPEWYCDELEGVLVYFDSWQDLVVKVQTTDYAAVSLRAKAFAQKHKAATLASWRAVLFRQI